MSVPISVIVLTLNEEEFIERCLDSVRWADEMLVLDSGSTDRTREIARRLGAVVYEQSWLGWSEQRTRAISLARHDWVLCVECDEIVSPELAQSIEQAMRGPVDPDDGYYLDRRGDFLGILLPNDQRPAKRRSFVRLFNRTRSAYDPGMRVHEEVRFPGRAIGLDGVLLHWRGYTMDEYIPVFNRYATIEAEILNDAGKQAGAGTIFWRPILRFFWSYVAKGGFRLGPRGLIHAMLKATSEYIRYAKLWEMQNAREQCIRPVKPRASKKHPSILMKLKSYWTAVGILLLLGMGLRIWLEAKLQNHFADDAYIFMRYVQNASDGHGLVYNIGARVIGFTSPLFVLLILVCHFVLRFLPLVTLVTVCNTLLFAALVVIAAVPRERFADSLALPILLLFYYPYLDASMNGMETMLFVTCIFGSVVSLTRSRIDLALVAATLAALTRPEGVLFLVVVLAQVLWTRPARVPWKGIGVSALLGGLWIVFAFSYYGTVLPQSMLAKATVHTASVGVQPIRSPLDTYLLLAAGFSTDSLNKLSDDVHGALSVLAGLSIPLVVLALITFLRKKDAWAIFPAFFLVVWIFYCVGKPVSIWSWYTIPTSMAFVVGLVAWVLKWVPVAGYVGRRLSLETLLALLCAGTIAVGLPARLQGQQGMTARLFPESKYVTQTVPNAKSVMVGDIGIVGYETGLRIIDMAGLVSPEVFRKGPDGRKISFGGLTQIDKPDVLLLREDPRDMDTIFDGLNRTNSFDSDAEKYRFDTDYVLMNVNYEFFHPFLFVKRSLVGDQAIPATPAPGNQGG